jgi:elongation factor 2
MSSIQRGKMFSEEHMQGARIVAIKGHLPVLDSFGFNKFIRSQTSGKAFTRCVFYHWETLQGSPLGNNSKTHQIIINTRKRKYLEENIPPLERFLDKL